jgi:mRNA-degrading endonuclease RelE of RelBE toxin-antitoxin system
LIEIFLQSRAERELARLPRQVQIRFNQAFELLLYDARRARPGLDIRPLRGGGSAWRLRVGDYRGIYELDGERVTFTRFAHRSKVYDL